MVVKNFVFRKDCVGRMVAGMKKTFFVIFDLDSHFGPKRPK